MRVSAVRLESSGYLVSFGIKTGGFHSQVGVLAGLHKGYFEDSIILGCRCFGMHGVRAMGPALNKFAVLIRCFNRQPHPNNAPYTISHTKKP